MTALLVYDDGSGSELYVAGTQINTPGGYAECAVLRWDGNEWSVLPPLVGIVYTMAAHEGKLYIGGLISSAGSYEVSNLARWDGRSWAPISGITESGTNQEVWALLSYDDGSGPALWIGGQFRSAGGIASSRIAKWSSAIYGDGFESGGTERWNVTVE